jgi:DNA-binding CsgD family transcriptional regulator
MDYFSQINFQVDMYYCIGLSSRQKEILQFILQGYNLKEIAEIEKISYPCVKWNFKKIKNIMPLIRGE